ncbi:MAG: enoyl-CoA hydratase/isomerase family protein [Pirellulales bacterium]|nr:enoyl-CoA hydratase/isomerase family protein [Pirellulales bacterium]
MTKQTLVATRTLEPGIAQITIQRPPVNALNADAIWQLRSAIGTLGDDAENQSIVLTGQGSFFSFGLDVPEILDLTREQFSSFLREFAGLYRDIFACPKPVIAALNGHATAGGCMIAIACDHRVMAQGRAKIGLTGVRFGAGLFAGSSILLRHILGGQQADRVAQLGDVYAANAALEIGLVDVACAAEDVPRHASDLARKYLACDPAALTLIRQTTRAPLLAQIDATEEESLQAFVELWYSPSTRAQVEKIIIRNS